MLQAMKIQVVALCACALTLLRACPCYCMGLSGAFWKDRAGGTMAGACTHTPPPGECAAVCAQPRVGV